MTLVRCDNKIKKLLHKVMLEFFNIKGLNLIYSFLIVKFSIQFLGMSLLFNDPFSLFYDPYFDSGIGSPRTTTFDWTPDTSWNMFSIGPQTPTWDQTTSRTLDTAPRSRSSPVSDQSRNVGSRIKINKMGDVVWRYLNNYINNTIPIHV